MAKARSSKSASPAAPKSSIAVATAPAAPAAACCGTATMEPPAPSGAKHASPLGKIGKCCQPSYEQIAQRAHQIWIEKGRPIGLDIENWKQAEAELTSAA